MPGMSDACALLCDALDGCLVCDKAQRSFSPWYSNVGLGWHADGHVVLFCHYNKGPASLDRGLLCVPAALVSRRAGPVAMELAYAGGGHLRAAFYGRNAWMVEATGLPHLDLTLAEAGAVSELRWTASDADTAVADFYLPCGDQVRKRDPDETVPVVLALRMLVGRLESPADPAAPRRLRPDDQGRLLVAMAVEHLDVEPGPLLARLAAAPATLDAAVAATRDWLTRCLGDLRLDGGTPQARQAVATAALTLAFNSCQSVGLLAGRVAAFPSRGGYPIHYLWDSCFQNLATEDMEPRLAEDALRLLTDNLRVDGKMAHFLGTTWMRPHESQPPLVGWAALRLARRRGDAVLARALIAPLERNTRWWLTQRMTRTGLIGTPHPLETGWDDTPRFDGGPLIACDMNAYLLSQMHALAGLARLAGAADVATAWDRRADAYGRVLVDLLWDEARGRFVDRRIADLSAVEVHTPAAYLPLWAGAPLPEERARRAVREGLLDPATLFGAVPFPSVAYDDPTYQSAKWWRGPTWMPVAWLMLELLDRLGFAAERRAAARRMYEIIVADGDCHELYDSRSGAPLGNPQQGWTAAILLRLHREMVISPA